MNRQSSSSNTVKSKKNEYNKILDEQIELNNIYTDMVRNEMNKRYSDKFYNYKGNLEESERIINYPLDIDKIKDKLLEETKNIINDIFVNIEDRAKALNIIFKNKDILDLRIFIKYHKKIINNLGIIPILSDFETEWIKLKEEAKKGIVEFPDEFNNFNNEDNLERKGIKYINFNDEDKGFIETKIYDFETKKLNDFMLKYRVMNREEKENLFKQAIFLEKGLRPNELIGNVIEIPVEGEYKFDKYKIIDVNSDGFLILQRYNNYYDRQFTGSLNPEAKKRYILKINFPLLYEFKYPIPVVRGRGRPRSQSIPKIKYQANFGKYYLDPKSLNKGKIKLFHQSGVNTNNKIKRVSYDLCSVINDLIENKKITNEDNYEKLDLQEKILLNDILKSSDFVVPFKFMIKNEDKDELIKRFNKVKGEIVAGNTNPEVINELKSLAVILKENKLLDKNDFNKIFTNL